MHFESFSCRVVPGGVSQVLVNATGASGNTDHSGRGGWVQALLSVTAGQTLYVFVGGANAYNGGGKAAALFGGNGGGATDIRTTSNDLSTRLIVAGGGGGGDAGYSSEAGGSGGNGVLLCDQTLVVTWLRHFNVCYSLNRVHYT